MNISIAAGICILLSLGLPLLTLYALRRLRPDSSLLPVGLAFAAWLLLTALLALRGVFNDFYAEAAEMLRLVTGWDVTAEELRATAARIVTAKKRFNIEAGWTPAEDTLPPRLLKDALPDDARARLAPERLATLVQAYNEARGWTLEGWLP